MNAAIETGRPAGSRSRSKIRPGGHGPRAVAFPLGLIPARRESVPTPSAFILRSDLAQLLPFLRIVKGQILRNP